MIALLILASVLDAQILLDRAGFSVNTIDGQLGVKTERALAAFAAAGGDTNRLLHTEAPFHWETVTPLELRQLVTLPRDPARKAELEYLGYESIQEMYAERGHVSRACLARLNPGIDFAHVTAGTRIRIPDVNEEVPEEKATLVKVSLAHKEITAWNGAGRCIGYFPCSIAANKSKLPPAGELRFKERIENPDYTYTPDHTPPGQKVKRYIFYPGPNNPVGSVWMGIDTPNPGYGIHGTPVPERVGNAESHGCFRLANWNARRLYKMTTPETRVVIER